MIKNEKGGIKHEHIHFAESGSEINYQAMAAALLSARSSTSRTTVVRIPSSEPSTKKQVAKTLLRESFLCVQLHFMGVFSSFDFVSFHKELFYFTAEGRISFESPIISCD